jgi:hypothetical protein
LIQVKNRSGGGAMRRKGAGALGWLIEQTCGFFLTAEALTADLG